MNNDTPSATRKLDAELRSILADVLALDVTRVAQFEAATPLFGALPELDSQAVAGLLTEMEDRLDIIVEDDEVDADLLDTFGSLLDFISRKRSGR
ncbi:acyl carrier protein [Croceicoccus sp. F390]|uniref:Acyl carrier protein n=1 Tax=Croceicoccus esteveae TaxID=3075597 RepID=A0ABU2ZKP7_9SPHN|nr:acyl carrier protein [Croceicoccus sp. F390]MDT0576904.1 acyl carrier protein [Croceicoccus sp. F390]